MATAQTSNVTSKGQVTVPVDIRRELGIKPGGKVRFVRKGKQIVLQAVEEQPISSLFGIVKVRKGRGIKPGEMRDVIGQAILDEYDASNR